MKQLDAEPLTPFSKLAESIQVGDIYEHYKGMRYQILAVGRHSESLEEMVVYQALYGKKEVWIRPVSMFLETVIFNTKTLARFTLQPRSQK